MSCRFFSNSITLGRHFHFPAVKKMGNYFSRKRRSPRPDIIYALILSYCRTLEQLTGSYFSASLGLQLLTISISCSLQIAATVCEQWRKLVEHHPFLLQNIDVMERSRLAPSAHNSLIIQVIKRSGNRLKHLHLTVKSFYFEQPESILLAILDRKLVLQSLQFHCDPNCDPNYHWWNSALLQKFVDTIPETITFGLCSFCQIGMITSGKFILRRLSV